MNKKNIMVSQQAKSIAAAAVIGSAKAKSGKSEKLSGITKLREVHHTEGAARHYSFVFFVGGLITLIAALCLGFILGVPGMF